MIELEERNLEKKSFFNRLVLIYFFFGILFSFFIYQTYSLQVSSFSEYTSASLKNKTRDMLVQPARGIIYDRSGNILVNNVPSYSLIIKPWKIESLDSFISSIGKIILLNEKEMNYVNENFKKKAAYNRELTVKSNLTSEEIAKFEVRSYKYPNAFIDVRYSRQSKYPDLFSHAIGYVGGVSNDQLSDILSEQKLKQIETLYKYSNGYLIGKTGIEYTYDNLLRGSFGKKTYEVDAAGRFLRELKYEPPVVGGNLFTTLDLEAQKIALEQMNKRRGAVVAVEIETGSIVTYLSSPSFSVNDIAGGMSTMDFNALSKDTDKPFFDRAGQGRYSPASTIKPLIGLFGLQEKIINWDFTIDDPGFFILPEDQRVYRGWKKGGHGTITLNDALIQSSNTFFFSLAYESNIDKLINYLSEFGFGKNPCLDCFNSDKGLLPSPEWKMNNLNFGWFKGDTVNLGVGQGYLSATPLQLSYYSAFLANKGSLKKLSFIKGDNSESSGLNNSAITDSDWDKIHESMIGVIENPKGTARRLKSLKSYIIAAKSGTVELVSTDTKEDYQIVRENKGNRDHAIIIAFGPMPNPKYAVSVVIENGESGGSVAGPVAIEVLNSLLNK
ncbi:penicillin-binding protein 2 [Gammaproteobacteria bacterium]|jgi:penicillin-binding protein 2|nr:penicillin-binding protein 2 [Gammaproteobacteria bacterium]MDA9355899.1 penicillin-binding protein 2 [Gammaproteobacteria bacterium]|tara:strand:+ start:2555 stop:4390 length:1836 start_codon:yes stop_codon:yes gene_type:complete